MNNPSQVIRACRPPEAADPRGAQVASAGRTTGHLQRTHSLVADIVVRGNETDAVRVSVKTAPAIRIKQRQFLSPTAPVVAGR